MASVDELLRPLGSEKHCYHSFLEGVVASENEPPCFGVVQHAPQDIRGSDSLVGWSPWDRIPVGGVFSFFDTPFLSRLLRSVGCHE